MPVAENKPVRKADVFWMKDLRFTCEPLFVSAFL
jgi:hypothetical protein